MNSQETPPKPARDTIAAVRAVVAPVVAAAGQDLEDVQLRPAGQRMVLRILVDTDSGVTLDGVSAVSTALSAALDDSGVMGSRGYVLDVGSPGVDRPLMLVRHWRRNTGRLVRIARTDGSTLTARIVGVRGAADDAPAQTVSVDLGGAVEELPAEEIRRAVVQVEFTDPQPLED